MSFAFQNPPPTLGEAEAQMAQAFSAVSIEAPAIEAVAILAEFLQCPRGNVRTRRTQRFSPEESAALTEIVRRRLNREPWQYIFGRAYFLDLMLEVSPAVLIPRPETELLVEWVCRYLPQYGSVLDVGTGSGAIALGVKSLRCDANVTAVDISCEALRVAMNNRNRYEYRDIEMLQSDLFSALDERQFNTIAANLPYITDMEYPDLQPEVQKFEPRLALTSGADGLDLIRRIVGEAYDHLVPGGAIILEIGDTQSVAVAELFANRVDQYCAVEVLDDYAKRHRFVVARRRMPGC